MLGLAVIVAASPLVGAQTPQLQPRYKPIPKPKPNPAPSPTTSTSGSLLFQKKLNDGPRTLKGVRVPQTFDRLVATIRTTNDDVRDGARAWVTIQLRSGALREVEISRLAKGANAVKTIEIPAGRAIRVNDIVGIKVRHESNNCLGCARDYWSGAIELDSKDGQPIMTTPRFRIGHETKIFRR